MMEPILDLISSAHDRLESSCEEIQRIRDELKIIAEVGSDELIEYVERLTEIIDEIAAWD